MGKKKARKCGRQELAPEYGAGVKRTKKTRWVGNREKSNRSWGLLEKKAVAARALREEWSAFFRREEGTYRKDSAEGGKVSGSRGRSKRAFATTGVVSLAHCVTSSRFARGRGNRSREKKEQLRNDSQRGAEAISENRERASRR